MTYEPDLVKWSFYSSIKIYPPKSISRAPPLHSQAAAAPIPHLRRRSGRRPAPPLRNRLAAGWPARWGARARGLRGAAASACVGPAYRPRVEERRGPRRGPARGRRAVDVRELGRVAGDLGLQPARRLLPAVRARRRRRAVRVRGGGVRPFLRCGEQRKKKTPYFGAPMDDSTQEWLKWIWGGCDAGGAKNWWETA